MAADRAEFNRWLRQQGWTDGGMKEWAIYRQAQHDVQERIDILIAEKATAEHRLFEVTEKISSAMPPLPGHPESFAMAWTELELQEIEEYGVACWNAGLAAAPSEQAQGQETVIPWGNTDARYIAEQRSLAQHAGSAEPAFDMRNNPQAWAKVGDNTFVSQTQHPTMADCIAAAKPSEQAEAQVKPATTEGCAGFQGKPVAECGPCAGQGCDEPAMTVDTGNFPKLLGRVAEFGFKGGHAEALISHIDAHTARAVAEALEGQQDALTEVTGQRDALRKRLDQQPSQPAGAVQEPREWHELASQCLAAMKMAVHFRKTGQGRPPEQTCLHEIEELEAMLTAPPAAVQSESEFGLQVEMTDKGAHVRIYSMTGEVLVDQFHESPSTHKQSDSERDAALTDAEIISLAEMCVDEIINKSYCFYESDLIVFSNAILAAAAPQKKEG